MWGTWHTAEWYLAVLRPHISERPYFAFQTLESPSRGSSLLAVIIRAFLCYNFPMFPRVLFLTLLSFLLFLPPAARAQEVTAPEYLPGELILGLEPGRAASALALPAGVNLKSGYARLERINAALLQVPIGQEESYLHQLERLPGVRFVERNGIVRADLIPNDSRWGDQYGPSHVQAPAAWDVTTGSSSVTLAIVDSGIDPNHPEFAGRLLPGYDFLDRDPIPQDDCGHGTHVAGIAAATGNNAQGIAGIAWEVRILPIRVLGEDCAGSFVSVAEGILGAVERGAKVINLSLGSGLSSHLLESATFYAYTHGAALIAAAGNNGGPVLYPARYSWVLAVGATDSNDNRTSYSAYGSELDLMAPGEDILSTLPLYSHFFYHTFFGKQTAYDTLSGTSMAAPHVAGAAALLAGFPQFDTPDKIYQALTQTARDLQLPGRDDYTGYGLLQIYNALTTPLAPLPTPTPVTPPVLAYDALDSPGCANLVSYAWRDTSGGTQLVISPGGNEGFASLALPFAFPFGGASYTTLYVNSNGLLAFDNPGYTGYQNYMADNAIIPSFSPASTGRAREFIAPFWDDLTLSDGGSAWYKVLGSPPNREVVIEYRNAKRFEVGQGVVPGTLTFQVVLFENGEILVQYKTLRGAEAQGQSATVGVEFNSGRSGLLFSYRESALRERLAIRFVPYSGTPPSHSCQVYTRYADASGGFYDAPPFCVSLPSGALQHEARLRIQPLSAAPPMPDSWLDLQHYADIRLLYYSPPVPISPMPEVYVCYHYTASDLLQAGGHPQNLRLMAYDSSRQRWQSLPTLVDMGNQLILARAPHLSIFGVATFLGPQHLPVTGAPFPWNETIRPWAALLLLSLILGLWLVTRFGRRSPRS